MIRGLTILLLCGALASASITIDPSIDPSDVEIDTVFIDEVVYHTVSVDGFPLYPSGLSAGEPCLPFRTHVFLLPPNIQIDEFSIIATAWDTLPGKYYLYPAQIGDLEDTTFTLPDPEIYSSTDPWPSLPVEFSGQGGMMGVGVANFVASPVCYMPADSLLLVLSSVQISFDLGSRQFEVLTPERETAWSAKRREEAILGIVENPEVWGQYRQPRCDSEDTDYGPLMITEVPSVEGDGVDMVIICPSSFSTAWQSHADLRTRQGIITTVRTVEWIEQNYSGCDTQERIRNFLIDAKANWGITMALLGGDDETVPARHCYELGVSPDAGFPSDDYYGELTEDWIRSSGVGWLPPYGNYQLELIIGRVTADNATDVQNFTNRESLYENPASFPGLFARRFLIMGVDGGGGLTPENLEEMNQLLIDNGISGPSGKYLDPIHEMYYPAVDPDHPDDPLWEGELLVRTDAIAELNTGYNIVFHQAHSGTHCMGSGPNGEALSQGDVLSLVNHSRPSILYTIGCWAGHFDGAECITERPMLTSGSSKLVAVFAVARDGSDRDYVFYFAKALYDYENTFPVGPYAYLGEILNYVKNYNTQIDALDECYLHLFGDPSMFVWRGDPTRLQITAPSSVATGTRNISITVKNSSGNTVPHAIVTLYKNNDVFASMLTNDQGIASFSNVPISTTGSITVTAVKRKTVEVNSDVVNFLPGTATITVTQGSGPLVCLQGMTINDDESGSSHGNDDQMADLSETIELDIEVKNTGTTTATGVTATLSVIGGSGLVVLQPDVIESLGNISAGATVNRTAAFRLELDDAFEPGEDPSVLLRVTFTYNTSKTFSSEADFRVYEGRIAIIAAPVDDPIYGSDYTIIGLNNIYAVNPALGALEEVEVEFTNPVPNPGYIGTPDLTSWIGDIAGNTGITLTDPISVTLAQRNWNGTFDLMVTDRWGDVTTRTIDVSQLVVVTPDEPELLGAGDDWLSVEWASTAGSEEFFVWTRPHSGGSWSRRNLMPVPVCHSTTTGLIAGTLYDVAVTAVTEQAQESSPDDAYESFSTCLPSVSGWPVQLDGSTGSGPAVADVDLDGQKEIVAATSTGSLYIIENTGGTPSPVGSRQPYIFTGVAVGDIYPGTNAAGGYGRPEIATSGWDVTNSSGVVLVYRWSGTTWALHKTIIASSGGAQRIHDYLSSPVLFQANTAGSSLEIALRTFNWSYSPGISKFYVWSWNGTSWSAYGSGYPVTLSNAAWDYANPSYVADTDGDNLVEFIVSRGNDGLTGSVVVRHIEIAPATPNITDITLTGFPSDRKWNVGEAMTAVVDQGGDRYLVGTARGVYPSDEFDASKAYWSVYCYNLDSLSMAWINTGPHEIPDHFGNFGGVGIGDLASSTGLEFVQQWERHDLYEDDQQVQVYSMSLGLLDSSPITRSAHQQQEGYGWGSVVTGGSIGGYCAALFGYSVLGHTVRVINGNLEYISGFPYWTDDLVLSTPVVADLDGDGLLEALMVDDSGLMQLFDWNASPGIGGWPTFQHDNWRTGYYSMVVPVSTGDMPDVSIVSADLCRVSSSVHGEAATLPGRFVRAVVEITSLPDGYTVSVGEPVESAMIQQVDQASAAIGALAGNGSSTAGIASSAVTVEVAVLSGDGAILGRAGLRLQSGMYELRIPISGSLCSGSRMAVSIDPSNDLAEIDESNNVLVLCEEKCMASRPDRVLVRDGRIIVAVDSGDWEGSEHLQVRLYSIDGRLIDEGVVEAGELETCLSNGGEVLPAGCYMVVMEQGDDITTRKVVVLR